MSHIWEHEFLLFGVLGNENFFTFAEVSHFWGVFSYFHLQNRSKIRIRITFLGLHKSEKHINLFWLLKSTFLVQSRLKLKNSGILNVSAKRKSSSINQLYIKLGVRGELHAFYGIFSPYADCIADMYYKKTPPKVKAYSIA
jgi:hypothetical protein